MTTATVTILATATTETLPTSTPRWPAPASRAHLPRRHGAGEEVPAEVHTAAPGPVPTLPRAHEALCAELADDASTLETVGAEGYVLLRRRGRRLRRGARYTA